MKSMFRCMPHRMPLRDGIRKIISLAGFAALAVNAFAGAVTPSEFRLDLNGLAPAFDSANAVGPRVPSAEPAIRRIVVDGKDIVVTAWVPAGKQRVTLECRPRFGPGSWAPESRRNVDGRPGEVEFRLSNRRELEWLRVRAESLEDLPLPAAFYVGKTDFPGVVVTNTSSSGSNLTGLAPVAVGGNSLSFDVTRSTAVTGVLTTPISGPPTVVESDIWRLSGQTLYFFNQGRGLQVIDLANPAAPRVLGELPVAANGEQMYLLPTVGTAGEHYVALLLASGCTDGGSVLVVRVAADGAVSTVNQLPFAGQLRESRLVGDVLYLAAYSWHGVSQSETNAVTGQVAVTGFQWQSDTVLTSYRLTDPAASGLSPHTVTLPANPDAIAATDQFLFVATTGASVFDPKSQVNLPESNTVEIIDISDPTGLMTRRGTVVTHGMVADKFKLSQAGDVLRVASFRNPFGRPVAVTNWFSTATGNWIQSSGGVAGTPPPLLPELYRTEVGTVWDWQPGQAWLETYSLVDAGNPQKLGELLLKENEQLYATRFAGDRVYVVTFRRVDPLFIVDLSDPRQPAIRGELQVPGFSTYLSPLSDDRLLAMGLENGQPLVSLFDVGDLTQPRLLSKVLLSAKDGWGYSEANNDEKAFNYSAETGLILFPWQGWSQGQSFQTIQLVDLKNDVLTRRGVIDHAVTARRATVIGDQVVSVSAAELLTVSIQDRDQPSVLARLPLQYRVDRTWIWNERLVQLANESISNGMYLQPRILLAPQSGPEKPTGSLTLPAGLSVLGLELKGAQLHVLQQGPTTYRTELQLVTNVVTEWVTSKEARVETNVNVTRLPAEYRVTYVTNWEVHLVPQPAFKPILATNETVVTIVYPLYPVLVPYQTNVICPATAAPCETNVLSNIEWTELPPLIRTNRTYVYGPEVPQPDLAVTNEVVTKSVEVIPGQIITNSVSVVTNWYPLPPVWQTNWLVWTNTLSVPVPGYLLASVVDCSGTEPRLLGQGRSDEGVFFNSGTLAAVWPTDGQVVWTDANSGGAFAGPRVFRLAYGGTGLGSVVMPVLTDWVGPGYWWRGTVRPHFVPVRVEDTSAPAVGHVLTAGEHPDWSAVNAVFAAEGKLYFSHQTQTQLPAEPGTNTAAVKPVGGTGTSSGVITFDPILTLDRWETRYYLDVLDLTDPVEPQWRAPLPLPGPLAGISHAGALLYTRGGLDPAGGWVDQLQALSYDGLEVTAVAVLPVNSMPLVLRPNGVVVRIRAGTNNTPAAVESWGMGSDAQWHRYAEISAINGALSSLHAYPDGLVVADDGGSEFLFLKSESADSLIRIGTGTGQCGLNPDWMNSDATLGAGLWLARGPYGLWHVRPEGGSVNP